jgi:alpha-D-ribose 1-methylphosphonate 5-triphosphate synthase subunit PhnL
MGGRTLHPVTLNTTNIFLPLRQVKRSLHIFQKHGMSNQVIDVNLSIDTSRCFYRENTRGTGCISLLQPVQAITAEETANMH